MKHMFTKAEVDLHLLVKVDLGIGKGIAKVWGCDFTKEYIEINADYRS